MTPVFCCFSVQRKKPTHQWLWWCRYNTYGSIIWSWKPKPAKLTGKTCAGGEGRCILFVWWHLFFFYHSNNKKTKKTTKTDCVVVGSYFEIWVWNASILVRVLVISSNTFSCYTRTKILNPTFTREINNTPDPTEYQQLLTCTATPKLLPSSILGTWSCTHIDTCHKNWNLYISV